MMTTVQKRKKAPKAVGKRVKTPTILQMESVECGAAALAIILSYYGRSVPLEKLRVACGVSRDGLKATNIMKAAREYNMQAKGYAKSIEKLKMMRMPVIIFWNFNHFLVLEGFTKDRVYLSDPAQGRYHVSHEEFDECFTGVVIDLEPTEKFEKANEKQGMMHALSTRITNSRLSLVFIILASLFLVIPGLIIPSFTQIFIDQFLINGRSNFVMPLLLAMGGVLLVNAFLIFLQQYYLLRLETKLALATSSKFLWHIMHLPTAFFTQRYAGEISNRVSLNDKVARLLSGDLANAALNVIVVIFYAILMFSYDTLLTMIGIVIAALNVVCLQLVSRARKDSNRRLVNESGKLMGSTMSGISMIETLKASGREGDFFTTWSGHLAKVMNVQQELGWLSLRLNVIPPFLLAVNSTVILGIGALRVMDGEMTLGMLVAKYFRANPSEYGLNPPPPPPPPPAPNAKNVIIEEIEVVDAPPPPPPPPAPGKSVDVIVEEVIEEDGVKKRVVKRKNVVEEIEVEEVEEVEEIEEVIEIEEGEGNKVVKVKEIVVDTPPPPPPPKSTLELMKEMKQKGAKFYLNGKSISADKAIELAKNEDDLKTIDVVGGKNGKYKVYLVN